MNANWSTEKFRYSQSNYNPPWLTFRGNSGNLQVINATLRWIFYHMHIYEYIYCKYINIYISVEQSDSSKRKEISWNSEVWKPGVIDKARSKPSFWSLRAAYFKTSLQSQTDLTKVTHHERKTVSVCRTLVWICNSKSHSTLFFSKQSEIPSVLTLAFQVFIVTFLCLLLIFYLCETKSQHTTNGNCDTQFGFEPHLSVFGK